MYEGLLLLNLVIYCKKCCKTQKVKSRDQLQRKGFMPLLTNSLTCRGSQVRVLYRPPDNLLEPQGFGRFFAACLAFLPYFLPYSDYPAETLLMTCSIRSALSFFI